MSTQIFVGDGEDLEQTRKKCSLSFGNTFLTLTFCFCFLFSLFFVGFNSSALKRTQKLYLPGKTRGNDNYANTTVLIEEIPNQARFLNLSFSLIRTNNDNNYNTHINLNSLAEFLDDRFVLVKDFQAKNEHFNVTFENESYESHLNVIFNENIRKFSKIRIRFFCNFPKNDINGVKIYVSYVDPNGQFDIEAVSVFLSLTALLVTIFYFKSMKNSHILNPTNKFFIAFSALTILSTNPLAMIFQNNTYVDALGPLFEASFMSFLRFFIICSCVSYINKDQKVGKVIGGMVIAYVVTYGIFELLSIEASERYFMIVFPKETLELSYVDKITNNFHISWCFVVIIISLVAVIKQIGQTYNTALQLAPFYLISVFATYFSKLNHNKYNPILSCIIYIASHVVVASVIIIVQNSNSDVAVKYQEPEHKGYEQVALA